MEQRAGAQISRKAFLQSVTILFILMILAGSLTRWLPAGRYERIEMQGRMVIDPNSYRALPVVNYPIWRWFTAPLEVLAGPDHLTLIVILLFLLMVGGSFAILDKCGILKTAIARIVARFGRRKYVLLLIISFVFMVFGAFFGIFEEVVPLIPIMLALSYLLGWDSLVGLGMSILATNMGFSAAVTNPFTIGIAQKIADLPLFSGAWFRLIIFISIYSIFAFFLVQYARKIDRFPEASPVFQEDQKVRSHYAGMGLDQILSSAPNLKNSMLWFGLFVILILLILIFAPFVTFLSEFALPLVGILFLVGGVGAGLLSGSDGKTVGKAMWDGVIGIAPGVPLILMAASVKYIVAQGAVMDTLLHETSTALASLSPLTGSLAIYLMALLIEFFIGSGSAKALLMMPIVLPLSDLLGVTRQLAVTAYCFGDGFSNLAYPTNPVLLISLGLSVVSYGKWLRWTLKLWLWVLIATVAFLAIGVLIHLGPF